MLRYPWFLIAAPLLVASGPIGKFDAKTPEAVYDTTRSPGDVERCLIDLDGFMAPIVYRQPDRPDTATIIWKAGQGMTVGRVDIRKTNTGTHVTSWFPAKQIPGCAP